MGDVVEFTGPDEVGEGKTFDPDQILEEAKGDFSVVVVIGYDADGAVQVRSSHSSREALWIIKKGERELLTVDDA